MRPGGRSDLLAYLTEYSRRPGLEVRRTERWRRRGWRSGRIAAEAERVAMALAAAGVAPGDHVALYLGDGPLWHAAFFGVLRAGAVAVPLDVSLDPDLLRGIAADLALAAWCTEGEVPSLGLDLPCVVLAWAGRGGRGDMWSGSKQSPCPWPPDDPDRIAEIVLTSGTGGAPKAVPVRHRNVRAVLDGLAAGIDEYRWAVRLAPTLRLAVSLPLSHLYGQVMGVFVPALLGARTVLVPPMPAPDLIRALKDERTWVLATVPRTLALLGGYLRARGEALWGVDGMEARLAATRNLSWWRRWAAFRRLHALLGHRLFAMISGGAALDPVTEAFWRGIGCLVIQGYGLTETAPLVTLNHPLDARAGSLGRPLPGVDVRIAEDGEILVRGPNVAVGHAGADGWFRTGDLGRRDADGRLYYIGRKGERIVTPAGVNIDPGPIVARLRREETVLDAVVMERPWGGPGVVCAALLVRPGSDAAATVRAVNRDLPDAARIRSWHVWPEADFPRTRTGKARRAAIHEWLMDQAQAESHKPSPLAGEPIGEVVGPGVQLDDFGALTRLVADIAGAPSSDLTADTPISDVLTSLDRVDLITRLEMVYGVAMGPETFAGEITLGDVADALRGGTQARQPLRSAGASSVGREAEANGERPEAGQRVIPAERGALPAAHWRFWPLVRAARFVFREACLRPFWHTFFGVDVAGLQHFNGVAPPFIVAANHLSELDPGAVLFALPTRRSARIATTAMWEYFPRARTGPALYALAVFGLDLVPLVQIGDWRPTLRIAGRVADRGGCLLVYPEGERSLDGRLLPFRKGVAVMAQELHLPIVPCGAAGLLAVLPKGSRWARNCWLGRAPLTIRFGAPLPAPHAGADLDAVVAALRVRIDALVEDAFRSAGRY